MAFSDPLRSRVLRFTILICLAITLYTLYFHTEQLPQDGTVQQPQLPVERLHPKDLQIHHDEISQHNVRDISARAGFAHQPSAWEAALGRGCKLYDMVQSADPEQSQWTDWSEISQYGWIRVPKTRWYIEDDINPPLLLPVAQGGLGAPAGSGPPQMNVLWQHADPSKVTYVGENGEQSHYNPTWAYYRAWYYPDQGIIVAEDSMSPTQAVKRKYNNFIGGAVTPLGQWSDIVFLEWSNLASQSQVSGLKYVFRDHIINGNTKMVIQQALQNVGIQDGPPAWPGHEFTMDTNEGKAILGTPNGGGVAWLLASHRAQLGHLVVQSVVAFDNLADEDTRDDYDGDPSLLFKIGPAEPAAQKRRLGRRQRHASL